MASSIGFLAFDEGEPVTPPKPSTQKRTPKAKNADSDIETPSKKMKLNNKERGVNLPRMPTSVEGFSLADTMLVEWRKEGNMKSWKETAIEYERLTGIKPGVDSIRKRRGKLLDIGTSLTAEEEYKIVELLKEDDKGKWARVAVALNAGGRSTHSKDAIEKHWKEMRKGGRVNEKGEYIGAISSGDDAVPTDEGADEGGDFEG